MKNILLCWGLLLATCFAACSQPYIVTGKIVDEKGLPVVGATIKEKGGRQSTFTDTAGKFSLHIKSKRGTLTIAYVGYNTKEVVVKQTHNLTVALQPANHLLDEVVIVGYGKSAKSAIGANASAPQVIKIPGSNSLNSMLVGRVAGVYVNPYDAPAYNGYYNQAERDQATQVPDREGYDAIVENSFRKATDEPLSTFSIDVDGASYSNVRRYLQSGSLPPAGAVRIEELVNYFKYDYPQPTGVDPFGINTELGACPWNSQHKLMLIGLQGKTLPTDDLPPSNLVFLIDVSGSMNEPAKLPLVKASLKLLTDQLREQDKVSLVVYAGAAGIVLPPTSGADKMKIKTAIDNLSAGGSTAGGAGIQLAYQTATANFIQGGNNRVILCTDGDFNVGVSSDDELETLIEKERESGIFLSVLGYGTGNYQDAKMQKLADKGNGNHSYIDGLGEARKVFINEFGGTLFTIAKDVKLQIEFNPAQVQGYRLIGYENRLLNKEDFNNDKKDAGELGSGHTVTALYELIPAGVKDTLLESVDALKYQRPATTNSGSTDWMTVKFRYKEPTGSSSKLLVHTVPAGTENKGMISDNFRFAAAVAQFGLLLRQSHFRQQASWSNVLQLASSAQGKDAEGYRSEFIRLVKDASALLADGSVNKALSKQ
jgi:Ca-activated chloride channel homolog